MALSCKEVIMGKQSSLGPIDPQLGGIACQSVIEEFEKAINDVDLNAMDTIAEGIRMYEFPEGLREIVEEMIQSIFNIDYDKCMDLAKKLTKLMDKDGQTLK